MNIEKNGCVYIVVEKSEKWTITKDSGKLSVSYDIPKEMCQTADELREYVLSNDLF